MTAQIISQPEILLSEDMELPNHPADLEQVIEAGFSQYHSLPSHTKIKKQYRNKLIEIIDALTDARRFKQFSYPQ